MMYLAMFVLGILVGILYQIKSQSQAKSNLNSLANQVKKPAVVRVREDIDILIEVLLFINEISNKPKNDINAKTLDEQLMQKLFLLDSISQPHLRVFRKTLVLHIQQLQKGDKGGKGGATSP